MTCFHPMTAYRLSNGDIVFSERGQVVETLQLPCGKCIGCKSARANEWSARCMHEASLHEHNVFATLVYDLDKLPELWSLDYRHFQLFMKRLRKEYGHVRFFMSGEYGTRRSHPHYHAILFGLRITDAEPFTQSARGDRLFRSSRLSALWGYGDVVCGAVTAQSARYVAKYSLKKSVGRHAIEDYEAVDIITGLVGTRTPEFCHMSLKPGIGSLWFDKYHRDIYPAGVLIRDGHKTSPPRYYDRLAKRRGFDLDQIKATRAFRALARAADSTPERLAIREEAALLAEAHYCKRS